MEKNLKETLEELTKVIREQKEGEKKKKFKIPFGRKVSNKQKRENYVTLVTLGDNNALDFKKVQIEDQTFMEDKIPRLAGAGYIFYWKKNPFIFLPKWSVEPITNNEKERILLPVFNSKEDFEGSLNDGRNTAGYRLLLAKMESAALDTKKKISGLIKWIFGLGILGIVIYAFATGSV